MMDAREELKDLIANPLPPEVLVRVPQDDTLPTRIYELDRQYENLQNAATLNREARKVLMDRAVDLNIGTDDGAVIIVREKLSDREIDPTLFKTQKPEIFENARKVEIAAAQEKIQRQIDALSKLEVGEPAIRIKTVQTMMSEEDITLLCFPRKITMTYEVLRAGSPLPKGKGVRLLTEGEKG